MALFFYRRLHTTKSQAGQKRYSTGSSLTVSHVCLTLDGKRVVLGWQKVVSRYRASKSITLGNNATIILSHAHHMHVTCTSHTQHGHHMNTTCTSLPHHIIRISLAHPMHHAPYSIAKGTTHSLWTLVQQRQLCDVIYCQSEVTLGQYTHIASVTI